MFKPMRPKEIMSHRYGCNIPWLLRTALGVTRLSLSLALSVPTLPLAAAPIEKHIKLAFPISNPNPSRPPQPDDYAVSSRMYGCSGGWVFWREHDERLQLRTD